MSLIDSYLHEVDHMIATEGLNQETLRDIKECIRNIKLQPNPTPEQVERIRALNQLVIQFEIASLDATPNPSTSQPVDTISILHESLQQLRDAEYVADDTLQHLAKQSETIQRCTTKIKQTNTDLSHSNKLLSKMKSWWRG